MSAKFFRLPAIAVAMSIGLAAAAHAEMSPGTGELIVRAKPALMDNQRIVSFRDLNLRQEAGQRVLRHRVGSAISSLCDSSHFSVTDPAGSLKCSNAAWDDVAPQLAQLSSR